MVVKFLRLGLIVTTYPRRRYTTAQRIADGDSELEDIGKIIFFMRDITSSGRVLVRLES